MPNENDSTSFTNDQTKSYLEANSTGSTGATSFSNTSQEPAPEQFDVEPSTSAVAEQQAGSPLAAPVPYTSSSRPDAQAYSQPTNDASTTPVVSAYPAGPVEPANPAAAGGLSVAPKKSKKRFVIAGVVMAVLALLIGGGSAAYALWYQNPDKVIGEALGNALMSESAKTSTVIKATNKQGDATSSYDIKLNTLNNLKDARADVAVSSDAAEATFDVSGSLLVKNNEKFFVKIDKLKELLEKSGMQSYLGSSESVTALIEKLDSNWVVVTKDEIEENTGTKDEASKCIEGVINKLRSDDAYSADVRELYKKYPLITVKQKLGSKDGSLGYEIDFARENAIKFADGVNGTKFFKDAKKCDDKIKDLKGEEIFKESDSKDDEKVKVVVWIDRWSHQFTKLEVTGTADDATLNMTTDMKFDIPVKIDEPKDAITIDELKSDIEAIQQEMMQANEASTQESMRMNEEMNTRGSSTRT